MVLVHCLPEENFLGERKPPGDEGGLTRFVLYIQHTYKGICTSTRDYVFFFFCQVYNYGIMRTDVLHGTSEPLKIGQ